MTQPSSLDDPIDAWVSATAQRALGYAFTLVRHRSDAEDIVHDCYSRLLARSGEYDLPRDGTKLLFRSITNACINLVQRSRSDISLNEMEGAAGAGGSVLTDRQSEGPAEHAIRNELKNALENAMSDLPVSQRAAVELRSMGHSLTEVAEMLQVSHSNARVLLHRARSALATKLRPFIEEKVQ